MSHRIEEKQARRAERLRKEEQTRRGQARQRLMRNSGYALVGLIALALVTLAIVNGGGGSAPAKSASDNSGAVVGDRAPKFDLTDVVSNKQMGLDSLAGKETLLFFSEGVNCQACMVQAADLQKNKALAAAGVQLVSVSTDTPEDLAQAAKDYGITTPLLSDPTTEMSNAYGMLAHGGMEHPTQDGHAFMLLSAKGEVLWHRAYQEMYVEPKQLLRDIDAES